MAIEISEFYCTKCGNKGIDLPRKKGQLREAGHLKKIWCPHCIEETNHAEVKEWTSYDKEQFLYEFNLGRFVDGVRVEEGQLILCSNSKCEYNVNNKCWNANKSYKCKHRL